jgi:FkbM family methyltransferase
VAIRHHWTGDRIILDAYRHKGYWWHGRRREADSIACCQDLLREGDTIVECGGHIGYMSLLFSSLVGPTGAVHVFEPGPNNLPYLRQNVSHRPNIHVMERAVGSKTSVMTLYVDDFTGQNNSLVEDYAVVAENSRSARVPILIQPVTTQVVTLDEFCRGEDVAPDFIKLDIEGFEIEALRGMRRLLADTAPMLMVELTRSAPQVYRLLTSAGYTGLTDQRIPIVDARKLPLGNSFWLHTGFHRNRINRLLPP